MHQSVVFFLLIFSLGAAQAAIQRKNSMLPNKENLLIELTGQKMSTSESALYTEIVEAYRKQDQIGLMARIQSMQQLYPQGLFIDSSLYILGSFLFEHKDYARALHYYGKVINDHPNSSRVAASYFAKGVIYKNMGLKDVSKKVLKKIIAKYPGSPEAFRAKTELKIL